MGKVKDQRRKAKNLALKEKRLRRAGANLSRSAAQVAELLDNKEEVIAEAVARGRLIGLGEAHALVQEARNIGAARKAVTEALEAAQEEEQGEEVEFEEVAS